MSPTNVNFPVLLYEGYELTLDVHINVKCIKAIGISHFPVCTPQIVAFEMKD